MSFSIKLGFYDKFVSRKEKQLDVYNHDIIFQWSAEFPKNMQLLKTFYAVNYSIILKTASVAILP